MPRAYGVPPSFGRPSGTALPIRCRSLPPRLAGSLGTVAGVGRPAGTRTRDLRSPGQSTYDSAHLADQHRGRNSLHCKATPDGDATEVRASLRVEADDWWGGDLIGPADWFGISANSEPFFELRLPDGRIGAAFVSNFDQASTAQRVTVAGIGTPPFG
jgi:hypothetical protein